jgi:hypothetical protein
VEEVTPAPGYSNLKLPRVGYNGVLYNLYRNGTDSVGLHSNAEPEIGTGHRVREPWRRKAVSAKGTNEARHLKDC